MGVRQSTLTSLALTLLCEFSINILKPSGKISMAGKSYALRCGYPQIVSKSMKGGGRKITN